MKLKFPKKRSKFLKFQQRRLRLAKNMRKGVIPVMFLSFLFLGFHSAFASGLNDWRGYVSYYNGSPCTIIISVTTFVDGEHTLEIPPLATYETYGDPSTSFTVSSGVVDALAPIDCTSIQTGGASLVTPYRYIQEADGSLWWIQIFPTETFLTSTSTATSTASLNDVTLGLDLILVILFLFVVGMVYNRLTDKANPWL